MGTWQDAIHRDRAKNSPATVYGCRIHVQGAIQRPQVDQAPDTRGTYSISDERSYNELSASIRCRAGRLRCDLCTPSCADTATFSTSGNTTGSEAGATCALCTTVVNATTGDDATSGSNDSAARRATSHAATATRGSCAASNRGVLSDLPCRAVPRVVRRRTRSALLHLRRNCAVCRRRDVLPDAARRKRIARLQRSADAHVRGGPISRRVDGVPAGGNGEGLDMGRVAGLREPEAERSAAAISHRRHDRPATARIGKIGSNQQSMSRLRESL